MTKRGFTLIELLITLVLIAVLLAVVPLTRGVERAKSSEWRAEIASARRRAIRQGIAVNGRLDSVGRYSAQPDGSFATDSIGWPGGEYSR